MRIGLVTMTSMAAAATIAAPALAQSVKDGVDAWQRGDYESAVRAWRPLAQSGDGDAAFDLAQAYKLGRGVPLDLAQAKTFYGMAARAGHIQGAANYGLLLFQDGDRKAALPWIVQASDAGDPRAQYVYGTALFNGDLVPKDWPKAYALMTRAAAAGLPQATTSLAQMDSFIPRPQRDQGMLLASDMAAQPVPPLGRQLVTTGTPTGAARRPTQVAAATPAKPPVRVAELGLPPRRHAEAAPAAPVPAAPIRAEHAPVQPARAAPTPEAPHAIATAPAPRPAPVRVAQATPPPPPPPPPAKPMPIRPAPVRAAAVRPASIRPAPAPVRPTPAPVRTAAVAARSMPAPRAAAPIGAWQVQLGAFRTEGAARAAWSKVASRLRGAAPRYERAGPLIRLRVAGPGGHDAGKHVCATAKGVGLACYRVS